MCWILHVNQATPLDDAWQLLQEIGLSPLYIEEDFENLPQIYMQAPSEFTEDDLLKRFAFIESIDQKELADIDWQSQWETHGLNYHEGYVHIDLPHAIFPHWKQLKLMPGAGFGDLSHPTTRLIIKMMEKHVTNQNVIDIGCGSGVLGLCAVACGAKHVYAIDIDEAALKHTEENAKLNEMHDRFTFSIPQNFSIPADIKAPVILMNMIIAEQQEAWHSLKALHHNHGICIVSGILAEQEQDYLQLVSRWNWKLSERYEEQGWLGFILTVIPVNEMSG